jgi:lipopolysaccharide/colanic/teichoic acid biosynthesis glycosyltransferase
MYSLILIRLTDFIISVFLIVILSPLFFLISIMILIFDGCPIFYISSRVGINGKIFMFYKFRTMRKDEISKIGKYLRRSSLDELPQLFHVLTGKMSIVGPRPLPFVIESTLSDRSRVIRRSIRPGITGYSQIYYNGDKRSWSKKVEYDIYYVKNKNILLYVNIILRTFRVIFIRFTKNKSGGSL